MTPKDTGLFKGGGYNRKQPIGIAMPSDHISNEPYHKWLKEKHGHLKMRKDRCILCEKETPWPEGLPVEYRSNYVQGVGQLCSQCWDATGGRVAIHPD